MKFHYLVFLCNVWKGRAICFKLECSLTTQISQDMGPEMIASYAICCHGFPPPVSEYKNSNGQRR